MDCCETPKKEHAHAHHGHHDHHGHEDHHADHDHGAPGMSHGSAGEYMRRFLIVTILLVPLALTNGAVAGLLGVPAFSMGRWIEFGLATVIFGFALVFFQHAGHELRARKAGMMTLVSLAVGSGYAFSVASTFMPGLGMGFYLEIATLVWVLLFGHYLEARSSAAAGDALSEVAKLLPKQAHRITDGREEDVDIAELAEGDVVLVKPGEKVPADGVILKGSSDVDESLISGESKPVEKREGAAAVAGSVVLDGSLTLRLTRVGEHSTIGQIEKLIALAGRTKPRSQLLADRAAGVLTFAALGVAVATVVIWSALGAPLSFSVALAITVLVIACPHALGLAIPTVTTIATSLAVRGGVFIKNLAKIETIKNATYVVFDKTGTLTEGRFGVTKVTPMPGVTEAEVLRVAASLDSHSSHIVALSIVAYARGKGIALSEPADYRNVAGKGSRGTLDGISYAVGNEALMRELGILAPTASEAGATMVYVADEKRVLGIIALSDEVKAESAAAISRLHALGIKVALLTGDNEAVAARVASELHIDTYFANVLPGDKYAYVKKLQDTGAVVLMVGDGINDAPALAQADAGIAIGAGTDVAVEAGDVVLMKNDPSDVAKLVVLSRKVYRKMQQNLVWALGYNVLAIPAAAGAFSAWGVYLRPEVGALLMSVSTVIVVINALSLRFSAKLV